MADQAVLDASEQVGATTPPQFEVVVIGSGVSGIYQLKRLSDLAINAVVLSTDAGLGGTWFNNRYPGARFDSESYTYGYSFSKDLLEQWHWKERFSGQPENLKYLQFVADKFDLNKYMRFNHTVTSMTFDEANDLWRLRTKENDEEITTRFVITALGLLSIPTKPRYPGMDSFRGQSFHTFEWPHEPIDLTGKRVGVVGTGATAIQVIADIADKVGHLTVFQRRANWAAPLSNGPISDEEMAQIRGRYEEIFETCARTPGGFEHEPDRRGFYNLTKEERIEFWDSLYGTPGFALWLRNFTEIFVDEDANAEFSEYIANRIRERVKDPILAEKLIPKDHGFGVQRVPMETHYYEVYNRDNVELVDISETPIEEILPLGIRTSEQIIELDLIVYATGFDAITGAFDHIDITGIGGQKLRDNWSEGPSTYLGAFIHGFPNLAMVAGPQGASASVNFPRSIETAVDWVTAFIEHVNEHSYSRFEASAEAEQSWSGHVRKMYGSMLMRKAKSWFTGYNSNVEGHEEGTVRYFVYNGGQPKFNERLTRVAANGYEGIDFS